MGLRVFPQYRLPWIEMADRAAQYGVELGLLVEVVLAAVVVQPEPEVAVG